MINFFSFLYIALDCKILQAMKINVACGSSVITSTRRGRENSSVMLLKNWICTVLFVQENQVSLTLTSISILCTIIIFLYILLRQDSFVWKERERTLKTFGDGFVTKTGRESVSLIDILSILKKTTSSNHFRNFCMDSLTFSSFYKNTNVILSSKIIWVFRSKGYLEKQ